MTEENIKINHRELGWEIDCIYLVQSKAETSSEPLWTW